MNKIKVSIIIPTYNVAPYIYTCLKSVASQTYKGPMECLIVDDCGQDNSIQIAENFVASYRGKINFKIIHHATNRGLSAARNTGLEHATGNYVYFLDSDDRITSTCIRSLVEPLKEEPYDFVIGDFKQTKSQNSYINLKLHDRTVLRNESILSNYASHNWYMMAWNKLVKRDLLQSNDLFFKEGIIHEDELWSFKLALAAKSMRVVGSICYIYNIREGSIMTSPNLKKTADSRKIIAADLMDLARRSNTISNFNVYNYIRLMFIIALTWSNSVSVGYSKQTYKELSDVFGINLFQLVNYCHFQPKEMVRDLHFIFPAFIGYPLAEISINFKYVYDRIKDIINIQVLSVNEKSRKWTWPRLGCHPIWLRSFTAGMISNWNPFLRVFR